jgi:hypothetical protein
MFYATEEPFPWTEDDWVGRSQSLRQLDVGLAATLDIPGIGHCDDEPVDVDSVATASSKTFGISHGNETEPGRQKFRNFSRDCTQLGTFETEHGRQKFRNFSRDCTQLGLFETRVPNQIYHGQMAGRIPQYIQSSRYSLFEIDMVPRGTLVIHYRT